MKKLLSVLGAAAALGVGALGLNTIAPASAGSLLPQAAETVRQTDPPAGDPAPGACPDRPSLKDVLDGLVTDGTITQEQEDVILQRLGEARAAAAANRPERPRAPKVRILEGAAQVAADTIGVTPKELRTAARAGRSVADVATANDVDPAAVEQAIVDAGTTKVDAAVAAGTITEQQGGFLKARLPEFANRFVTHVKTGGC